METGATQQSRPQHLLCYAVATVAVLFAVIGVVVFVHARTDTTTSPQPTPPTQPSSSAFFPDAQQWQAVVRADGRYYQLYTVTPASDLGRRYQQSLTEARKAGWSVYEVQYVQAGPPMASGHLVIAGHRYNLTITTAQENQATVRVRIQSDTSPKP